MSWMVAGKSKSKSNRYQVLFGNYRTKQEADFIKEVTMKQHRNLFINISENSTPAKATKIPEYLEFKQKQERLKLEKRSNLKES